MKITNVVILALVSFSPRQRDALSPTLSKSGGLYIKNIREFYKSMHIWIIYDNTNTPLSNFPINIAFNYNSFDYLNRSGRIYK